jgi:hypothetical protein
MFTHRGVVGLILGQLHNGILYRYIKDQVSPYELIESDVQRRSDEQRKMLKGLHCVKRRRNNNNNNNKNHRYIRLFLKGYTEEIDQETELVTFQEKGCMAEMETAGKAWGGKREYSLPANTQNV